MIEMTIDSIRVSLMNYQRVVILKEKMSERYLPIWIGPAEADAIAVKLQGVNVPRPLTHDLLNTVIDALHIAVERIRKNPPAIPSLPSTLLNGDSQEPLVLITGHRRENFGDGFERICRAISELSEQFLDTAFVYPVHLNPNVRKPVFDILSGHRNIYLIEPLSYLPFVALMNRARLILTDSGGVQEEAPSLGKPVLVMRDTTERPEAVDAGTVRLVGTDRRRIIDNVSTLLTDEKAYNAMAKAANPYGDGKATGRILTACERFLDGHKRPV